MILYLLIGRVNHYFIILFSYWFSITTIKSSIATQQKKQNCKSVPIFINWGSFSNREKRLESWSIHCAWKLVASLFIALRLNERVGRQTNLCRYLIRSGLVKSSATRLCFRMLEDASGRVNYGKSEWVRHQKQPRTSITASSIGPYLAQQPQKPKSIHYSQHFLAQRYTAGGRARPWWVPWVLPLEQEFL